MGHPYCDLEKERAEDGFLSPFGFCDACGLAMSAVGTAATTVEAATTAAVEATATRVAAMEAAAGVHVAGVIAAAVAAREVLVGLGACGVAARSTVEAASSVRRTSGVIAEASVARVVCGDLIAASEVGGHAASSIVRGHVIATCEIATCKRSAGASVIVCAGVAYSAGASV